MAKLEAELEIAEIGARGDGIADMDGERVFVSFTVPGDRVLARLGGRRGDGIVARATRILAQGPGRAEPACAHFGECGGCSLQHLDAGHYRDWKRGLLRAALARHGIEADIAPLAPAPPRARRRADLTALRRPQGVLLGFNARSSHRVVDMVECHILAPAILALVPHLRDLLAPLLGPGERAELVVSLTASGLDLLFVSAAALGLAGRERLATFAADHGLARISHRHPKQGGPETVAALRPVQAVFGGVAVPLPAGAFLQATAAGEALLVEAVVAGARGAKRIADLYCGCGTFTFPLAKEARVWAIDGLDWQVRAVERAARDAGLHGVVAECRNLDRKPLSAGDLDRIDMALFDPPRAGAKAQAETLAGSAVPVVVAVSCNPATFARDARILTDGGYGLTRILPIDQFPWSPHLELVATFRR